MAERPKCLACGKPLCKHTRLMHVEVGEVPTKFGHTERPIVEIVRRKRSPFSRLSQEELSVWLGDWGRNADGFFCGPACGYLWAVRTARKQRESNG